MRVSAESARPPVAGARTLRRGLAVLRLLCRVGPGGLRMGEIARRVELNKATAVRLTRTLVDEGFVVHASGSGRYRLGPEAYAVGLAAEPSYELQRLAAPTLRQLALDAGDTVYFTVLHGYESICLRGVQGVRRDGVTARLVNCGSFPVAPLPSPRQAGAAPCVPV